MKTTESSQKVDIEATKDTDEPTTTAHSDVSNTEENEKQFLEDKAVLEVNKTWKLIGKTPKDPDYMDLEIDFGHNIRLVADKGYFSGVEWSCESFALTLDAKTIAHSKDFNPEISLTFKPVEDDYNYPSMISKGNKHLILLFALESPNEDHVDALKIEEGKFTGYIEKFNPKLSTLDQATAEAFFDKAFPEK